MNRMLFFALGLVMAARAGIAQDASQAAASPAALRTVVVRAQWLIDGIADKPRHNMEIVIRDNRIVDVRAANSQALPAAAQVIDLGAATVLPGLIDTHTHIFLQGEDPAAGGYDVQLLKYPASYRAVRAAVSARRALEQGFTSIREPKGSQLIDGPIEARKAAREQLDKGADWIKVYMTHRSWLDAQGALVSQPTLTVEELKAVVDETHGWGRRVACHAYNGPGLQRALDGGCDSIEHGLEITDAQIAQMLKQGTWYVPTLQVYYTDWEPPDTEEGKRDRKRVALHGVSFTKALHAGVKMAFGTDVGGFKWSEPIAEEFAREVEFGMTPMQAIKSATSRAADLLGKRGELGVVAPGAYADLIAVAGDPLADVSVLKAVHFVMKDGAVFKSSAGERVP